MTRQLKQLGTALVTGKKKKYTIKGWKSKKELDDYLNNLTKIYRTKRR